jgi:glycosyltransferase involved in cell wall biosynthesis
MDVTVTLEFKFNLAEDGSVWTPTTFPNSFWQRYRNVFDNVVIVARAKKVTGSIDPSWKRVDGNGVSFIPLPYYQGPIQFAKSFFKVKSNTLKAINQTDAIIFRVASPIAFAVRSYLVKNNRPYGIEVVGDPYDLFSKDGIAHPLRTFFQWYFPFQLKKLALDASAGAYVTEYSLQRRYPLRKGVFSTHFSNIQLDDKFFLKEPKVYTKSLVSPKILMVGQLNQLHKGPHILIQAVKILQDQGINVDAAIAGDGKRRVEFEQLAQELNVQIRFLGSLPGVDAVVAELDRSDIFVLPSISEGLPRAMIEAMARGLPCIGTNVGGIPELISSENIVKAGSATELAKVIKDTINDIPRLNSMSEYNLKKSHEYREDILDKRRISFYNAVKDISTNWKSKKS